MRVVTELTGSAAGETIFIMGAKVLNSDKRKIRSWDFFRKMKYFEPYI
jgi:hypothetical protein